MRWNPLNRLNLKGFREPKTLDPSLTCLCLEPLTPGCHISANGLGGRKPFDLGIALNLYYMLNDVDSAVKAYISKYIPQLIFLNYISNGEKYS